MKASMTISPSEGPVPMAYQTSSTGSAKGFSSAMAGRQTSDASRQTERIRDRIFFMGETSFNSV